MIKANSSLNSESPAMLLSAILLASCATTGSSSDAASSEVIADQMSAADFRAYGQTSPEVVETHIGELSFTEGGFAGGYPTLDSVDLLVDEMDFQRATQGYLWALPLVSYAEWLRAHEETFNAADGQLVKYTSMLAKQGILTGNATTPYVIGFADLVRTGPLVFDVPEGPSAGIIDDMWQRGVRDFGVSGPDAGKGVKFVILAPGVEVPADLDESEFVVVRNSTNIVFLGIRALQADPEEAQAMLNKFQTYPYADRANPKKLEMLEVSDDVTWGQWQPHGMAYWESLKKVMDREVFEERDRFILCMLEGLGVRLDREFAPDERQSRLLKEAAVVGEAMAKANTFSKSFEGIDLYKGTHWDQLMIVNVDDRAEHVDQMYRRAAFTWEAVTRGKAYYIEKPGIGQQYRTAYNDGSGEFLTGSRHYTLTMPPNPPAKTFWSIVVYDVNTRTLILNGEGRPAASSRTGLQAEEDGTVTVHFGPTQPEEAPASNWIQTNPGESWFTYLRFYGPTEAYFDQSYPLQDIQRAD